MFRTLFACAVLFFGVVVNAQLAKPLSNRVIVPLYVGSPGTSQAGELYFDISDGTFKGVDSQGNTKTFNTENPSSGAANLDLSNLTATNITVDLLPVTPVNNLGSLTRYWSNVFTSSLVGVTNFTILTDAGQPVIFGDVYNLNPIRLTNVSDPIDPQDVATKSYVDTYIPGNSSYWAGTPPSTTKEALDRMAALLYTLNGSTQIP